ncbi:response regulator transcription factor [Phycicoccus sonneratiae]|uniref:Response regulator transcription factor n=1 Tax=Phycicoccus sonneratiae TaxID=2807628 RepID=A0ABS2CQW0_9MICO|nr:response regulator transcription factor [Phycicoccus sonneraticus]MBM6402275.1 response regulator transcription factor [Phycicoccus sonneraticus]
MPTVLVVDDDPVLREVVVTYLERAGIDAVEAGDGLEAVARARATSPDLVLLDLTLPGLDGLEAFRRMRAHRGDLPVVMLTARGEESDRVLGLELGADDYVGKPFSARELVLRVQAVLRRTEAAAAASGAPSDEPLVDGDLVVDRRRHEVRRAGQVLPLTAREFDLLAHLVSLPGQAFSRADLMRSVWGWEFGDESTVTVHVRRLREKVEDDPSAPRRLCTVWGVGYRWEPTPVAIPDPTPEGT